MRWLYIRILNVIPIMTSMKIREKIERKEKKKGIKTVSHNRSIQWKQGGNKYREIKKNHLIYIESKQQNGRSNPFFISNYIKHRWIKWQWMAECIWKKKLKIHDSTIWYPYKTHFRSKDTNRLKVKMWKMYSSN